MSSCNTSSHKSNIFPEGVLVWSPFLEYIKLFVAEYYGVELELLSAKTRKRKIVFARHVAMFAAHKLTDLSLEKIGIGFGDRDHSTVINALRSIRNQMSVYKEVKDSVEGLIGILSGGEK